MKYKVQFLFCLLGVSVLCLKVCVVFAKAPDTAKIVFAKANVGETRGHLSHESGWQREGESN